MHVPERIDDEEYRNGQVDDQRDQRQDDACTVTLAYSSIADLYSWRRPWLSLRCG
jgi:hypothetical protein